jgi:hypothetical protein
VIPVGRRSFLRPFGVFLRGAALIALGVLPAVAQETDPFTKLDPNSRFAVELIIDSANTLGLPSSYLRSTALQGLALGIDGRRIVSAVRQDFVRLKTARAALGPASNEELVAAASVLHAGAKPAQLAPFRARQSGRSDLAAFTFWADLITRGVPSEEASSAITKLWQEGADDATFYGLWNNVQSDILRGLNPGAALQNRIREAPGRPAPTKVTPPEGPQENQSSR